MIKRIKDGNGKLLFDETGAPVWGIDVRISQGPGKPKRRLRANDFRSRDEAEKAVAAIKAHERASKYGFTALKDKPKLQRLIAQRLETITVPHEKSRARRVLYCWLRLLDPSLHLEDDYSPVNGYESPVTIEQIETPDVRRYVELRTGEGQSPASIDRELNIISATLNAAKDFYPELRAWLSPKMPRPKLPKTRRERIISDDEYRRILAHLQRVRTAEEKQLGYQARIRAAHLLRFALLTGMRPKEIFRLRWEDLDEDHSRIRVRGTKTENRGNSTRYVPLTRDLAEIVAARRAVGESMEFVFSISGSPRYTDYDLLKEACEINGIPYGRSVENGFELYCARHTFTTKLLLAGLSLAEVGAITGHSDRELVLYYSHVTPESSDRARERLEEIEARRLSGSGQIMDKKEEARQ